MFALTVFEILLSECRSILAPAQHEIVSERVKVSVETRKVIRNLLKFLEYLLTYRVRRFLMTLNFFFFFFILLNPFSIGDIKKLVI